jgi:hypothetical protein
MIMVMIPAKITDIEMASKMAGWPTGISSGHEFFSRK